MLRLGNVLFRIRSYTPLPFLALALWIARPTAGSIVTGMIVIVLGEAFRFWGVGSVGGETRATGEPGASALVTTGPYAYVRNPLYIGNVLIYCGFGAMAGRWDLVAIGFIYFAFQYIAIVAAEESRLREMFGAPFDEFCRRVPRFIPRLTPATRESSVFDASRGVASERRTFQALAIAMLLMIARWML
jgi:protein-S-isoprenylcysteine O-methyltransferase Ste14